MSTAYDVYCFDHKICLGLYDAISRSRMCFDLIRFRKEFVEISKAIDGLNKAGYKNMSYDINVKCFGDDDKFEFESEFFLKHEGCKLVVRDEYGHFHEEK